MALRNTCSGQVGTSDVIPPIYRRRMHSVPIASSKKSKCKVQAEAVTLGRHILIDLPHHKRLLFKGYRASATIYFCMLYIIVFLHHDVPTDHWSDRALVRQGFGFKIFIFDISVNFYYKFT